MYAVYVVFFYLVWQILTRSDETEILSHLPSTSPLRGQQQSHAIAEQSSQQQHYQFPYPLAPFPSPARDVEKSSTSTWRTVWHSVLYPFYLLVTLAVIPLPFLNQALTLVMSILGTILYPLTSTARLLSRTFIVGPLQLVTGLFQALYPAYVFVGGVLGLGCFLGMSAGYIGRYSLDFLLTRRSSKNRKTRSKTRKHSTHKTRVQEFTAAGRTTTTTTRATVFEHPLSGHRAPLSPEVRTFHGRYVPVADIWDNPDLSAVNASASARQPVVVGLRRRGMRIDDS